MTRDSNNKTCIPALSFRSFSASYKGLTVLDKISFDVSFGKITAIVGENGAGKSTLFRHLVKLMPTPPGQIFICGRDITSQGQRDLSSRISLLPQNPVYHGDITVAELIELRGFGTLSGFEIPGEINEDLDSKYYSEYGIISRLGLKEILKKPVSRISGGEFQRAMIARVLSRGTQIVLLDEPVNNLDPRYSASLFEILKEMTMSGIAVLCVLHDISLVKKHADDALLIKDGAILAYGEASDVLSRENLMTVFGVEL